MGWRVWLLCAYFVLGSLCFHHNVEEILTSICTYCGRVLNLIKTLMESLHASDGVMEGFLCPLVL